MYCRSIWCLKQATKISAMVLQTFIIVMELNWWSIWLISVKIIVFTHGHCFYSSFAFDRDMYMNWSTDNTNKNNVSIHFECKLWLTRVNWQIRSGHICIAAAYDAWDKPLRFQQWYYKHSSWRLFLWRIRNLKFCVYLHSINPSMPYLFWWGSSFKMQ